MYEYVPEGTTAVVQSGGGSPRSASARLKAFMSSFDKVVQFCQSCGIQAAPSFITFGYGPDVRWFLSSVGVSRQ
eukprot:SAG25_NODE_2408_length_1635_cov_0.873698_1_plen_74_part_00